MKTVLLVIESSFTKLFILSPYSASSASIILHGSAFL
jgi:hypothetical protein